MKIFVVENFSCAQWPKQSHSTRRLSAYMDTTYTKTFGKWQLVKQLSVHYNQVIFMTKNAIVVEKDGSITVYLQWRVSLIRALFLKTGGTVRCTVTGRH